MAIVVKEASNTPLAIAALAKNMADTYVNWNNSERDYAKWQQEQTWRNEDRARLGDLASELGGMDTTGFVGGRAGQMGAINAAYKGNDISPYFASSSAYNPLDASSNVMEHAETTNYFRRQNGELPADPIADQRWESMYNRPGTMKDGMGMDNFVYDKRTGQIIGVVEGDEVIFKSGLGNAAMQNSQPAMQGGNGEVAVGTPTPNAQAPSMTGDMVTHDGIKVSMKDIQDLAKETGATVDQIIAMYGIKQQ